MVTRRDLDDLYTKIDAVDAKVDTLLLRDADQERRIGEIVANVAMSEGGSAGGRVARRWGAVATVIAAMVAGAIQGWGFVDAEDPPSTTVTEDRPR